MPTDEVTVGPLTFEYDPDSRYLGIARGEELVGTAELFPEDWEAFAEAAKDKDVTDA